MSIIHSSDTVPSSASSSLSLSDSDFDKREHHARRNKLVNTSMKKSNTLFLFVNMHGGIYLDHFPKCLTCKNPFDALLRYIVSAPGEATKITDNRETRAFLEAFDNDFEDIYLTPNHIVEELKTHTFEEDRIPLVLSGLGSKGEALHVGDQNFGFEKRNQTLINYKGSPYCRKSYELDNETPVYGTDITNFGIYCLNTVKNGWTAPTNILFDRAFIDWVKQHYTPSFNTYKTKMLGKREYIFFISNEIIFDYVCNELKIKKLFLVDYSCDIDNKRFLPDMVPTNLRFKANRDIIIAKIKLQLDELYLKMLKIVEETELDPTNITKDNIYSTFLQNQGEFTPFEANQMKKLNTLYNDKELLKMNFENPNSDVFKEIDAAEEDMKKYVQQREDKIQFLEDDLYELYDDIFSTVHLKLGFLEHTLVMYKHFIEKKEKMFGSEQRKIIKEIISQTKTFLKKRTLNKKENLEVEVNFDTIADFILRKDANLKSQYLDIFFENQDRFSENEVKRIQKIQAEIIIKERELQELLDNPESTESERRQTIRQKRKVYYDKVKPYHTKIRRTKKYQANAKQNKGTWGVVKEHAKRTR